MEQSGEVLVKEEIHPQLQYSEINLDDPVTQDEMEEMRDVAEEKQGYYVMKVDNPSFSLGAKTDTGELAGFIEVSKDGTIAYIVRPEFQGQGIATKLLSESIPKARQKGLNRLAASVEVGSISEKLIKNGGFKERESSVGGAIQSNKVYEMMLN